VSDFHALFDLGEPSFVALSDDTINAQITRAGTWTPPEVWGAHYAEGVLFRAAHELCLQLGMAGQGGAWALAREYESKSVGGVSVSRGTGIARDAADPLARTIYGQQLRFMIVTLGIGKGPLVAGGGLTPVGAFGCLSST
jgi:hypothetical protein